MATTRTVSWTIHVVAAALTMDDPRRGRGVDATLRRIKDPELWDEEPPSRNSMGCGGLCMN